MVSLIAKDFVGYFRLDLTFKKNAHVRLQMGKVLGYPAP